MLREYDLLGPLEGVSGLVVSVDKGVDLIANLAWRGETRAGQGFGGENGEPYLHLIEPGRMGRGKMEMDVLVPSQPAVVFGLVGIEIVQNHMDLAAGMFGNHAVHEIQELDAPAALIMAGKPAPSVSPTPARYADGKSATGRLCHAREREASAKVPNPVK